MKVKKMGRFRHFAIDLGKGIFAGTVTGVGLQLGRDFYVYAKEKFLGKKEQPTLVRIADQPVATATGQCCDQK